MFVREIESQIMSTFLPLIRVFHVVIINGATIKHIITFSSIVTIDMLKIVQAFKCIYNKHLNSHLKFLVSKIVLLLTELFYIIFGALQNQSRISLIHIYSTANLRYVLCYKRYITMICLFFVTIT